jgi:hypothetical protein
VGGVPAGLGRRRGGSPRHPHPSRRPRHLVMPDA